VLRFALTIGAAAALAPASADAKLIPPPGPWPTTVSAAANPLIGTPFTLNGAYATANADLRIWIASRGERATSITRTVGKQTVIDGRLRNRDNRRPIVGATVTLATQNVYASEWTAISNVRTSQTGEFRAILPPGYHRRAAVLYFPAIDAPSPIFSRRLLIRAKSRVDLAPPVRTRRAYRFDGQVSAGGAPVPASGLLLALQVKNRHGNWITARLSKTTPSGRFRIRYTFPTPGRLKARIAVPAQTAWALYAGHSQTWTIEPR